MRVERVPSIPSPGCCWGAAPGPLAPRRSEGKAGGGRRWPRSPASAAAQTKNRELVIRGKGVGDILRICFTSTVFSCSDRAGKALIGGGSDLQNQLQ